MHSGDAGLSMAGGRLMYRGQPFRGILIEEISDLQEVHRTPYVEGVEHGEATIFTRTGIKLASREYVAGIKHGKHQTWFPDGKRRSYAEFDRGNYSGESWAWYSNGNPGEFTLYDNQGRPLAAKKWRETGQIYFNFVFSKNVSIGMPGSKLCDPPPGKK
ncbi:MAG: hypothetical protein HS115_02260 [Spirochaetales bacterium]|nr:hypothetical protein [Spirochaetales bacterium]